MNPDHFFCTFGYCVFRDFWSADEIAAIRAEFDRLISTTGIMACCADSSPALIALIDHPKVKDAVAGLLGDGWLYKGSDGNVFNCVTPWHRDYFIRTPTIKLLTYLDPSTLDVIPGSHFVGGPFSRLLNEALTWPEPPVMGGFDEKGLLANDSMPYQKLSVAPGDVIIFCHNLIHRTSNIDWQRRLLGLHFAAEFTKEIEELTLIEMRTFNVPTCYGQHVPMTARTAPFHALRNDVTGAFGGKYSEQSGESIRFGRRLM